MFSLLSHRLLRRDKDEQEALRQAKLLEEEKAQFAVILNYIFLWWWHVLVKVTFFFFLSDYVQDLTYHISPQY